MAIDSDALLARLRARYALRWEGIHGFAHWQRVRDNGLLLAPRTGADAEVVEAFAWLHDVCRVNDAWDPRHGPRAARLAATLEDSCLGLGPERLALLQEACARHTDGLTAADVTVQTCWDADRLDLGRVGIRPRPRLLCTDAARDPQVLAWAIERSRTGEPRPWRRLFAPR